MPKPAVITEYSFSSPKLSRPLTVAQVADLHERRGDDILRLLRTVSPDLIVLTGDTMERFDSEARRPYLKMQVGRLRKIFLFCVFHLNYVLMTLFARQNLSEPENATRFLEQASALAPVVMSLGNHEQKLLEEDFSFLRAHGIVLLDNSDTALECNGNTLLLGGLSTDADEAWLERFARQEGFKLLLCHHPEYYDLLVADKDIDLTLAGHNHGGQIRLFGRGLMASGGGVLPQYDKGMFHGRLIVSAGCANTVAIPRLGNPRELTVIRLLPEDN